MPHGLVTATLAAFLAVSVSTPTGGLSVASNRLDALSTELARLRGDMEASLAEVQGAVELLMAREYDAMTALAESRIDPGALASFGGDRGVSTTTPTLGASLMTRLRADAAMGTAEGGSTFSGLTGANMLDDPVWQHLDGTLSYLATSGVWQALSPHWEAQYVLNSGSAPATRWLGNTQSRVSANFYDSGTIKVEIGWGAVASGDVTILLRPTVAEGAAPMDWPYVIGSTRVRPALLTDMASATVKQQIVDGATVLAESDAVELQPVLDISQEVQPFAAWETDGVTGHRYQLRIDLVKAATVASAATIYLSEPQHAFSDEESPPVFHPAIAGWNPVPYLHGVRVNRNYDQTISDSTWTAVSFNGEDWDSDGFWAIGSPTLLTAPFRGYYRLAGQVSFASNAKGRRALRVTSSVGMEGQIMVAAASGGRTVLPVPGVTILLLRGESVDVQAFQASGGNLALEGSTNEISVSMDLVSLSRTTP